MAQIVASMCSNLLLTPQNSTIFIGAPTTKGDHLLVNTAQLVKFQSYLCMPVVVENHGTLLRLSGHEDFVSEGRCRSAWRRSMAIIAKRVS